MCRAAGLSVCISHAAVFERHRRRRVITLSLYMFTKYNLWGSRCVFRGVACCAGCGPRAWCGAKRCGGARTEGRRRALRTQRTQRVSSAKERNVPLQNRTDNGHNKLQWEPQNQRRLGVSAHRALCAFMRVLFCACHRGKRVWRLCETCVD